jgi:hypothetical protein
MDTDYVSGVFWYVETPERQAEGRVELENPDLPSLIVTTPLFDERTYKVTRSGTGGMTIATSGDPHDRVADFQPRTIWGDLSNGAKASAIGAQGGRRNGFGFDFSQQFRCRRVVVGAHVDDQQVYAAARFCLAEPHWALPSGEATTKDGSTLRVLPPDKDGKQWIEFEPTQPATLTYFDWQVMNPITTLYELVTDSSMVHRDFRVRLEKDSQWMPVYEGIRGEAGNGHDMIETKHLTPERLARWIDVRKDSDGLDAAVIDDRSGDTIQTRVLSLSAVAEGLHRKLFADPAHAKRVSAVSKRVCADARDAARAAAVAVLEGDQFTDEDRAEFAKAMDDALSHVNERTFRSRMRDLVDIAERVVPGITESFKDWPDAVCKARNTLAHQGNESLDDFEMFFELLVAVQYSLVWVLRTVLLDRAGIDPETIQFGYRWNGTAYGMHLANVRSHLLASGRYAAEGLTPG